MKGVRLGVPKANKKTLLIVAIVVVAATAGALLAWYKVVNTPSPEPLTAAEKHSIMQTVATAMKPTTETYNPEIPLYNYERAKANMDELAAKNPQVAASRYYAINFFKVCLVLSDEECARQNARTIKRLSTEQDPYTNDVISSDAQKIEEYAR